MKLKLGTFCLILSLAGLLPVLSTQAQSPQPPAAVATTPAIGSWRGTLQAGKALRIVFIISSNENGFSGRMYSIDQSPKPIALSEITIKDSQIKFLIATVGGSYTGTLSSDGTSITGTWNQGGEKGVSLPLNLAKVPNDDTLVEH